ncbi:MAG: hypothetical protein JNK15_10900 [Planctomycetes bacterium]|nr:hypothetical protein [Planctomycetota bacterium]
MHDDAQEIDARLQTLAAQVRALRAAERGAADVRESIHNLVAREQAHRQRAERAARELLHARSLWPGAVWARITGSARDRVAAAERVIASARSAIDELEPKLAAAQAELERHTAVGRGLGHVVEAHAELLRAKEQAVLATGGEAAVRGAALAAAIEAQRREVKAVRRVLENVRAAESALQQARDHLGASQRHANLDLLVDSMLVTTAKHSSFDAGRTALVRAQQSLANVRDEVEIDDAGIARVDLGGGLRLADFLLDSLVVELTTRSHIAQVAGFVRDLLAKVTDVVIGLERRLTLAEAGRAAAEAARIEWLESVRL